MSESRVSLRAGFLRAKDTFPERPALEIGGVTWRYAELAQRAAEIARTLAQRAPRVEPPLTAVFASRTLTAFAGVLASLFRGHGFVPLNPAFPITRTRAMLDRSEAASVVVDRGALPQLDELLAGAARRLCVLVPDELDVRALAGRHPRHRVLGAGDLLPADGWRLPEAGPIAYLLFTSGSTGVPKGVAVSQANVVEFVAAMVERYTVSVTDRFSQMFDLTFDLSVFDMFVAWQRGACVVCPTPQQKMLPARFIGEARLSIWFSVPSTGLLLERLGLLKPGAFPALRLSLFCGEALPAGLAAAWQRAAPNSTVENLYGPTELTIACTRYRWDELRSAAQCVNGLVPIGEPIGEMQALVVDEALAEVPPGASGELLMTGPQLTLGYWRDPERTRAAFVTPPARHGVYYRTGDRVRRPRPGEPLVYLGRKDLQVKVQGYRVELGEVEAAVRDEARVARAVAVGWPLTNSGAEGVVAFVADAQVDAGALLTRLRARLPAYMTPSEIRIVDDWPLDANGKVDRNALARELAGQ